jgi:hypothetical protein
MDKPIILKWCKKGAVRFGQWLAVSQPTINISAWKGGAAQGEQFETSQFDVTNNFQPINAFQLILSFMTGFHLAFA